MAIVTFPFAEVGGARAELDVNNANWRVSKARVINNSAYPLKVIVYQSGTPIYSAIAPANQTTEWNLSPYQLGWDSVYGGLILGDYGFGTQYPAEQ